MCILKYLAYIFFKLVVCNPFQSSPSLTILVPVWFLITSLVFLGFHQFEGNFAHHKNYFKKSSSHSYLRVNAQCVRGYCSFAVIFSHLIRESKMLSHKTISRSKHKYALRTYHCSVPFVTSSKEIDALLRSRSWTPFWDPPCSRT